MSEPTGPAGLPDLGALLQQAQQLMAAQAEASAAEVEGHAGGGLVTIRVTGGGEFRSVRIQPDAVDPDDLGLLEDLVLAALRDAMAQVQALQSSSLDASGLPGLDAMKGLLGE